MTPSDAAEKLFELLAVAARGFRPPRVLVTSPFRGDPGEASAPGPEDREGFRQAWSVLYRCIAETGPPEVTPDVIYLLGVNPPSDLTDQELGEFNAFYTDVHLPEVAARRHALRGVRYELVRAMAPPSRGAPRFLAVYELDEEAASVRRHVGPPYSPGPDVWQRHSTPWRLWYRLLDDSSDSSRR